ncbi:MAG: DUF1735 domain-containing protein [Bacteroidales bacterium]
MKSKITQALFLIAAVFAMESCLKDKIGENWTSSLKGKMYAEIPKNGEQVFVIQPVATDQVFKFLVNIATDALPSSDITVSLGIDLAAMAAYNQGLLADTSIHYSYQFYPGATILDPEVTIKAGTRNAYCHIRLPRADTLDLNNKYMVPVTISNVTAGVVIAENKKTVLYTLPLANKWEGTYKMSGYVLRESDPVLSGFYSNRTVKLATNGPRSVVITTPMAWAGNGGDIGGIGSWIITIDESATPNPITVSDPTNSTVTILPTYPNRYDPTSRTFYMSVYWGTGPTNRATTDTLVYSAPLK